MNFSLAFICFIHIGTILFSNIYPDTLSMKRYKKSLEDLKFPVVYKYCFHQQNEREILNSIGYNNLLELYRGKSKFDPELYGWTGHKENNKTVFESPQGKYQNLEK